MGLVGQPGTLVISLDHELYWGVRDIPSLDRYEANLRGERRAIRGLLRLFREYEVHATWATVGFLFLRDRRELLAHLPERRPGYRDARLSPYGDVERVGEDEERDPLRLGASLLDEIRAVPGQEIGTHTFSHYYALEPGQDEEAFRADLDAAVRAARARGVELRSIVFPRNQVNPAYLPACAEAGLVAYRGTERGWAYGAVAEAGNRPLRRAFRLADAYLPLSGHNAYRLADVAAGPLVNVPSSRFLRPWSPRLAPLEGLRLRRIAHDLAHAAREGLVYHLWWHPHNFGVHTERNLELLRRLLEHAAGLRERYGLRSLGMAEAASA
ncbi:MAG TPA: hypothetical protein VM290_11510 [Gaiellaceae bacterium]|nr:hypothetical protein [Gaiellaceae bacterium]